MINSFITSFKLKNTYRVNSIIYSIKQLPIIKKILPESLYKNKEIKMFANIISILVEISSVFIGKIIYILLMIMSVLEFYKTPHENTFIHIFFFLTILGGFLNTFMFAPTKDKYYAMILMRMDAKKYTLSNYFYELIKCFIGFLPFTVIFGLISGLSYFTCLMLPIFVVSVKLISSTLVLMDYNKNKRIKNENRMTKIYFIIIIILLSISYGLPYIGIALNIVYFNILFAITLISSIYCLNYINKFNQYRRMYKDLLAPSNIFLFQQGNNSQLMQTATLKQIELNTKELSNKKGIQFLNDIFVKRHRKIITRSANRTALIALLIAIIVGIIINLNMEVREKINNSLLIYLPYFVFVMYMINRGQMITQSMFMSCDHSMLTYKVYRNPRILLRLFRERLKTLININLLPAIVISLALPTLLLLSGGTDNVLNYLFLFISIIAMSIFFSVHYLVLYYLLQPYNVNIEMKSATYSIAQFFTYVGAYTMIHLQLSTVLFGTLTLSFSIIYCVISLFLIYNFAQKTFKLRN